ncbi:MAG: DUF4019 domain-containing protein, partial [Deltaproteobacteria bacterium]|nr:DUF4019 domain-containing protein [Deltaproteobacteria bacterium]
MQIKTLILVLVCLILFPLSSSAADEPQPLPEETRVLIQTFFSMTDEGRYKETYDLAAPTLKKMKTRSGWANLVKSDRERMGEVKSRQMVRVDREVSFPDFPDGQYLTVVFQAEFSKQSEAEELVTVAAVEGGGYGLVGYKFKYNRWPEAVGIIVNGLLAVVFIMVLLATITWVIGRVIQRAENNKADKEKG